MNQDEVVVKLLNALHKNPELSQRELAKAIGIMVFNLKFKIQNPKFAVHPVPTTQNPVPLHTLTQISGFWVVGTGFWVKRGSEWVILGICKFGKNQRI